MRRYPGITPFRVEDAPVFCGRSAETQDVTNLILTQKTLILNAKSGMGKTSLLNAGVVPALKRYSLFPIFIRFNEIRSDSSGDHLIPDPVERFKAQYEQAYTNFFASRARADDFSPQPTLWKLLCRNQFVTRREVLIPVLIFDQFEEFFRTYPLPRQRVDFLNQLAELLSDSIPHEHPLLGQQATVNGEVQPLNLRVVFSIRSDRLNFMQEVREFLPFVMRTSYELKPLTHPQATQAIREPGVATGAAFDTGPITFPDPVVNEILTGLQDEHTGEIESFQLQLVCYHLEDKYVQQADNRPSTTEHTVTQADYGGVSGIQQINEAYFSDTLNAITDQPHPVVLGELITLLNDTGNRILREDSELTLLPTVKDALVDRRILKRETIQGNTYYEISHDKIALALQKEKDRIEAEQERLEHRKRRWQLLFFGAIAVAFALLGLIAIIYYFRASEAASQANTALAERNRLNAKLIRTNKSLITAQDLLRNQTKQLASSNRILMAQKAELVATIDELSRTKLSRAWREYDNALTLMRSRLFDKAVQTFPVKQQDNLLVQNWVVRKQFVQIDRLVVQARHVCENMKKVQQLVADAECLELSLQITCANQKYKAAQLRQQSFLRRYGIYCYPPDRLASKIETTNPAIAEGIYAGLNDARLTSQFGWLKTDVLRGIYDGTNCTCNPEKQLQP